MQRRFYRIFADIKQTENKKRTIQLAWFSKTYIRQKPSISQIYLKALGTTDQDILASPCPGRDFVVAACRLAHKLLRISRKGTPDCPVKLGSTENWDQVQRMPRTWTEKSTTSFSFTAALNFGLTFSFHLKCESRPKQPSLHSIMVV